jgi:hypothetical protein
LERFKPYVEAQVKYNLTGLSVGRQVGGYARLGGWQTCRAPSRPPRLRCLLLLELIFSQDPGHPNASSLLRYSFLFCSIGRKQQGTRVLLRLACALKINGRSPCDKTGNTSLSYTYCTCLPPRTQRPLANNKLRAWTRGIRGCYGTCLPLGFYCCSSRYLCSDHHMVCLSIFLSLVSRARERIVPKERQDDINHGISKS